MGNTIGKNPGFVTDLAYNRYVNLDNIEWHIIDYLMKSDSKYADYLWKILKYNTPDCLSLPSLTLDEKMDLVYVGNGDASNYRVFMTSFVDDTWEDQSSHLHVFVNQLSPKDHLSTICNITIECITHNKIAMIYGDASEFNPDTNPSEMKDGEFLTPYKNRCTVMLKTILADLNGRFVNGVGTLQFSKNLGVENVAKHNLWNLKKFFGYQITFSTIISGTSDNSFCGY